VPELGEAVKATLREGVERSAHDLHILPGHRLTISAAVHVVKLAAVTRCFGDGDPLYERYHDEEWGFPVLDERGLYERMTLEAFQSGLSWRTILAKRDAFRRAFSGFDPDAVARFGDDEVERLLGDAAIVRNRAKIEAALANARATVALRDSGESLDGVIRAHAPERGAPPETWEDVPSTAPETVALARELKRRGFRFVGPTTLYALMQACGLVNDHLARCPARPAVERARRAAGL
jgi:DNA-3-methyladenine glycosylase I